MKSKLKIGIVQMSMTRDYDENVDNALKGVRKAAELGAEIVCLPELFAWRYFPTSRKSAEVPQKIPGHLSQDLSKTARENGVALVGGSIYEKEGRNRYNTCLVFGRDGKLLSRYRKVHIPQDDHYYEQDYFASGRDYSVAETPSGKVGTLICFDQWYPEAARVNKLMGADLLFYPTAIGWVRGIEQVEGDWKQAWEAVQVGHAIANSMIVCAVNRVGKEGSTTFWGDSFVSDQFGKVLFRAGPQKGTFVVECNLNLGRTVEEGWRFMRNRKSSTYSKIAKG